MTPQAGKQPAPAAAAAPAPAAAPKPKPAGAIDYSKEPGLGDEPCARSLLIGREHGFKVAVVLLVWYSL